MKHYLYQFFSILCLLFFLTACNTNDNSDLSGIWKDVDGGSLLEFQQTDNKIVAFYSEPSENSKNQYGFQKGDKSLEMERNENKLTGKVQVRYPEPFRSNCPDKASIWTKCEFEIDETGQFLKGRWLGKGLSDTCTITGTKWLDDAYERVKK